MNSFEQCWNRLTAAARRAASCEIAPVVPAGAWLTRVAARGAAEYRASRGLTAFLAAWAVPGFGVAALLAIAAAISFRPVIEPADETEALVALADPLADRSLFP